MKRHRKLHPFHDAASWPTSLAKAAAHFGAFAAGIALAAASLAADARAAAASPADLVGLDATQIAAANPLVVGEAPSGQVLRAPSGLLASKTGFTATVVTSASTDVVHMRARPDANAGFDVDSTIYGALTVDGSRLTALATADLPERGDHIALPAETLLTLTDVRRLSDRVALGLVVAVPLAAQVAPNTAYSDEREAMFSNRVHMTLLEDDRNTMVVGVGIAAAASARLTLGLGAQLIVGAAPNAAVYVPNALEPAVTNNNAELGVRPALAPTLSAHYRLSAQWQLAAALTAPSAQKVRGTTEIRLWAPVSDPLAISSQPVRYDLDSQPWRAVLGATTTFEQTTLGFEAAARRGSDYRDYHGDQPVAAFGNTLELGIVAHHRHRHATVTAGARYVPSPVPNQDARENHADTDRIALGAGAAWPLAKGRMVLAAGLSAQRFLPRSVEKDVAKLRDEYPDSVDFQNQPVLGSAGVQTNNPGFPGFDMAGWLGVAAVSLTVKH